MAFDWKATLIKAISNPTPTEDSVKAAAGGTFLFGKLSSWAERNQIRHANGVEFSKTIASIAAVAQHEFAMLQSRYETGETA